MTFYEQYQQNRFKYRTYARYDKIRSDILFMMSQCEINLKSDILEEVRQVPQLQKYDDSRIEFVFDTYCRFVVEPEDEAAYARVAMNLGTMEGETVKVGNVFINFKKNLADIIAICTSASKVKFEGSLMNALILLNIILKLKKICTISLDKVECYVLYALDSLDAYSHGVPEDEIYTFLKKQENVSEMITQEKITRAITNLECLQCIQLEDGRSQLVEQIRIDVNM